MDLGAWKVLNLGGICYVIRLAYFSSVHEHLSLCLLHESNYTFAHTEQNLPSTLLYFSQHRLPVKLSHCLIIMPSSSVDAGEDGHPSSALDSSKYLEPLTETINSRGDMSFTSSWGTKFFSTSYDGFPWEGMPVFSEHLTKASGSAFVPAEWPMLLSKSGKRLYRCADQVNLFQLVQPEQPRSPRLQHYLQSSTDQMANVGPTSMVSSGLQSTQASQSDVSIAFASNSGSSSSQSTNLATWEPGPAPVKTLPKNTKMEPPPLRAYATYNDAYGAVNEWAIGHGYSITSTTFRGRSPSMFRCGRGGKPPKELSLEGDAVSSAKSFKRHPSKKVDCPFALTIRSRPGAG